MAGIRAMAGLPATVNHLSGCPLGYEEPVNTNCGWDFTSSSLPVSVEHQPIELSLIVEHFPSVLFSWW